MEISKEFRFEASHILPRHPGKCSRLHGHSWKLTVSVKGLINETTGFVLDYGYLSAIVKPLIEDLDHRHLGTWYHPKFDNSFTEEAYFVPGLPFDFYPSSENLLIWIADQLEGKLAWSQLELEETCTSKAILTYKDYEAEKYRQRSGSIGRTELQQLRKENEAESVVEERLQSSEKEVK